MIDEQALVLLEEQQRKEAQKDFLKFLIYCKPDFVIEWYHRYIAQVLNEFVFGDIDYLMIFMPPRHGKSEMVSRHLPAFIHGNFPNDEIMAASYNDSLAGDMCMDVQKVMDSLEYREIFPNVRIPPPKVSYTKGIRNSEEHHIVGHKGKYRGQGVGGSFTGKGANWICFPSGVDVDTQHGYKDISKIRVGDLVWSYNHESGKNELKRVENVFVNRVSRLVQVTTAKGRKVPCTPDHPFYSATIGDYRKAQDLRNDALLIKRRVYDLEKDGRCPGMYLLQERFRKDSMRVRKKFAKGNKGYVLFKRLLSTASQLQEQKVLCCLQESSGKENSQILQGLLGIQSESKIKKLSSSIQNDSRSCNNERQFHLCSLPIKENADSSSHRRGQEQQFIGELNHSMQEMPCETPLFDTVNGVEDYGNGEIVAVYDIKVEGNHNFYADGILVHNCVDDPIKGRETADSAAFRERLWNFWNNDLFTRRETDLKTGRKAKALITLTRWHEDDLAGRLLENMVKDPNAVKWKVILFPAIKENNDNPDDPREIGEALWPAKFNINELKQIRSSIGERAWGSLYQQDPTPIGGAIFAPRMFKYGKVPDSYDYTFITADTAYKDKQENDFTAFTHFGVVNKQLYVIKVYRKQIKAVEIEDDTRPFIEASLEYGFRALLVEPKGHGIYLNQKWASKGYMIPSEDFLREFFSDRKHDKVERAHNIIGHLAYRHIIINEDIEDKEDLVRQCTSFPKVAHDDFVDTLIDGVKYVYGTEISMFDLL